MIEKVRLFSGLTPAQLSWVIDRLHTRAVPAGVDLIIAGTPGEVVYFILKGTVKVYIPQIDGTQVIVTIMGPGDTVGELSVIDSAGRSASVIALEETQVAWMNRSYFQEALRTIPTLSDNLMRILSSRVRVTTDHIQAYASLDTAGRIARQILSIAHTYGLTRSDGTYIPLRLTQGDIAELVGASRKRVNQVMVALKREGILSFDANAHITVHRKNDLDKLAGN